MCPFVVHHTHNPQQMSDTDPTYILSVSSPGPETSAVRSTLDFIGINYEATLAEDEDDMSFLIPAGMEPNTDDEDDAEISGFPAVFMLCSRWAHTMPSNALHAALVTEKVEFARHAPLDKLEKLLAENAEKERTWLCGEFVESTAADFFLVCRLRHMRSEEGATFDDFPLLAKYVDSDPSLKTSEESEDEEEVEPPSRVQMFCTVS